MPVLGLGVDVVAIERMRAVLARTPAFGARVFTPAERVVCAGRAERFAARFAAKEAVAKCVRAPGGLSWYDAEVLGGAGSRPTLEVRGSVLRAARVLSPGGELAWHVSLSHDAGSAVAVVVLEAVGVGVT